jgi:uncharacterized cupredoxin-like copper-binding protein
LTKKFFALFALLTLVLGGCATEKEPEEVEEKPAEASRVTFKTIEYGYSSPPEFRGGLVEIELDNTGGNEPHEAQLILLEDGKTAADYLKAIETAGPPPAFGVPAGGPGPVDPGKKAVYTGNLAAGSYVFICNVSAPDGKEHFTKGMVGEAKVSEGTEGALPKADATLSFEEFRFIGVEGLRAGTQTVKAVNKGQKPHHMAVLTLAEGRTAQEALGVLSGQTPPNAGPPPFTGYPGFVATFAPGAEATRTLELEAGKTYLFVCFIPDVDGIPHLAKGMQAELQL